MVLPSLAQAAEATVASVADENRSSGATPPRQNRSSVSGFDGP
jgi:hypothetical protein